MPLQFGIFMAPFHPLGDNPTLAFQRDLELIQELDHLGLDEAWVGEHHSAAWETISSPEMFLAAAGERTRRIRLGTGVVSLPYHNPFHVADRIVLLDHLTHGRAMLGVGPGALPGDAKMLGLDALRQREMMDESLGVILRLLKGDEPVTYQSDWITLDDARLQLRPYQQPMMPVAVASTISPSGMTAAGKHGVGVLSIASHTQEGLRALPTHWSYAEKAARDAGQPAPDRANWRVLMVCHLAEDREQAVDDVADGITAWNHYLVNSGSPNGIPIESGREIAELINSFGGGVIGTPDDAIARITTLLEKSGGFGCLLAFATEWTSREKTLKSYELFARYVMPKFQDSLTWLDRSWDWTNANREELASRTRGSIMKAITDHPDARRIMQAEMEKTQQASQSKEGTSSG